MAEVSKKSLAEEIKSRYYAQVAQVFAGADLEVLKVGSAEMAIPVLDKNGDVENESEVNGTELIKAIQSAMNVQYAKGERK